MIPNNDNISISFGINKDNKVFPNNKITTTKYNLITIIPKGLFIQFKKSANIYFLIVTIMTYMDFSPKKPESQVMTFAFVLIATLVKEAIEDYGRYKQDKLSNNKLVEVYSYEEKQFLKVKCWKLMPGDIIKIGKEEELTADVVLITSSNVNGYCYIDTKNLDGETNLKEKLAIEELKESKIDELYSLEGEIIAEKPNECMVNWRGMMKVTISKGEKEVYVDLRNMILKGCVLKNTSYIYGVIVYTGSNTKIMKNSKSAVFKTSKVLRMMNRLLYSLFIFQFLICLVFSINNFNWSNKNKLWYIDVNTSYVKSDSTFVTILINFIIFFVAYSHIIPISLYVVLEIIKLSQGFLIYYDDEIFDFGINKPASCKTTDLIEELGQVEFIFSDKTGTLTQNVMILKKVYVNNKIYGNSSDDLPTKKLTINGDRNVFRKIVSKEEEDEEDRLSLIEFFNLLSVCHSVFPDKDNENESIVYQGASPDDIALVKGSQQVGFEFVKKDFQDLYVYNHILNIESVFEILVEIPFDSDRKRMSVLVKDKTRKKYIVYTKGADTVMLPLLKTEEVSIVEIEKIVKSFSKEGLRVLLMGYKEISEEEYCEWNGRFQRMRKENQDLTEVYDELETSLYFLGSTAIEDKLQEGVPEAIFTLLSCNIKIWVLTGDKQDTAEEIGKSCNLITESMHILYFCDNKEDYDVYHEIYNIFTELDIKVNKDENNKLLDSEDIIIEEISHKIKKKKGKDICIIVDGKSLEVILNDFSLSRLFFKLAISAKSVVCCRVSPKQKARVVNLAKSNGKWITLAIGDGANDVPMIMEAHIGIGIQGKEGTQAVRSSDYSIGQFRFLEKLMLVYGRVGYMKISRFICYYFYKNIFLLFTELFFSFYNGFSGQIYFADILSTMYNAIFTSWPVLCTFVFEKDVDLKVVKKFPSLYKAGQENFYFNLKEFWKYIIYAIVHGTICFYSIHYGMDFLNDSSGFVFGHWVKSTITFSLVINIVTLKLLIISNFWNFINIWSTILSLTLYYGFLGLVSLNFIGSKFQYELIGTFSVISSSEKCILILFLIPIITLLPDLSFKLLYINAKPNPVQYVVSFLFDKDFVSFLFKEEQRKLMLTSKEAVQAEKVMKSILREEKRKLKMSNKNIKQMKYKADDESEERFVKEKPSNKLLSLKKLWGSSKNEEEREEMKYEKGIYDKVDEKNNSSSSFSIHDD